MINRPIQAVVIGASAGGVETLNIVLGTLTHPLPVPILVVLHTVPEGSIIVGAFESKGGLFKIKEAEEKETLQPGHIYFAPPNHHLLIEDDHSLSLSVEEQVNFARPSIDVLFESASDVFGDRLLGILLTGANEDGAAGLRRIRDEGGVTVVQDPVSAYCPVMPSSALKILQPDYMLPPRQIGELLETLR